MNLGKTLLEKDIYEGEASKLVELLVWLHPEKNETERPIFSVGRKLLTIKREKVPF